MHWTHQACWSFDQRPKTRPIPRDDLADLELLGIAAQLADLRRQLMDADYKRLPSLRAFVETGARLVDELGYGDR